MPYIPYADVENSDLQIKKLYDEELKKNGQVTNMKKTLLHSAEAFQAYNTWYPLKVDIVDFIGERGAVLFSHAISSGNACLLCSTYFRKILIENGENPEELVLNEKERLLVEFGVAIAKNSSNISGELYDRLDALFSKSELLKLVAFAGIMSATNLLNSVLKVELDEYLEGFKKSKA